MSPPPAWLVIAANVFGLTTTVMLFMYLTGSLECNRYVRLTLALQVGLLALTLVAWARAT